MSSFRVSGLFSLLLFLPALAPAGESAWQEGALEPGEPSRPQQCCSLVTGSLGHSTGDHPDLGTIGGWCYNVSRWPRKTLLATRPWALGRCLRSADSHWFLLGNSGLVNVSVLLREQCHHRQGSCFSYTLRCMPPFELVSGCGDYGLAGEGAAPAWSGRLPIGYCTPQAVGGPSSSLGLPPCSRFTSGLGRVA